MSLNPKLLQGDKGTVKEQIDAGVIYLYWDRGRARWGEDVVLGALVSGYKDGTAAKLKIFEKDDGGAGDDPVKDLDATIDRGLVHATYTIDFEDPDVDEGAEYEMYFLVEVDGRVISFVDECPLLYVDLTLPIFSE